VRSPDEDRIGSNIVDWWPTTKIAKRRDDFTRDGKSALAYWAKQRQGTLHTAKLLYKCKDSPEHQAAVLIAASAWDKLHELPAAWNKNTFSLVNQIFLTVCRSPEGPFAQRQLPVWHYAMRGALPAKILDPYLDEGIRITAYREFVQLAIIEATLFTTIWSPVIVSHEISIGSLSPNAIETRDLKSAFKQSR
jgi:hypothetical protein